METDEHDKTGEGEGDARALHEVPAAGAQRPSGRVAASLASALRVIIVSLIALLRACCRHGEGSTAARLVKIVHSESSGNEW